MGRRVTILLFLDAAGGVPRWMRVADGGVAPGEGPVPGDAPVVAIAPADAVTLHWAELPSRSPAQALAAARILVAEASVAPPGDLHVAVGDEGTADRPIAVVANGAMAGWLATCAALGIDPVAIVPAALLLPRPAEGFVRAGIDGRAIVRGAGIAFAAEEGLTALLTDDAPVETLSDDARDAAIVAAIAAPPLDLRVGAFARRRKRSIDWRLVRRAAWLGLAILTVTLAIDLVRIAKYSFGADALQAETATLAASGLPRGETVTDVGRQLDERLSGLRGPGRGFSATAAGVYAVVRAMPGVELTALSFAANGDLRIGVSVEREALATDLKRRLEVAGFTVNAGTFQAAAGRVTGEMTVTAR